MAAVVLESQAAVVAPSQVGRDAVNARSTGGRICGKVGLHFLEIDEALRGRDEGADRTDSRSVHFGCHVNDDYASQRRGAASGPYHRPHSAQRMANHDNVFELQRGDDRIDIVADCIRAVAGWLNPVALAVPAEVDGEAARTTTQQVSCEIKGVGVQSAAVQHQHDRRICGPAGPLQVMQCGPRPSTDHSFSGQDEILVVRNCVPLCCAEQPLPSGGEGVESQGAQ